MSECHFKTYRTSQLIILAIFTFLLLIILFINNFASAESIITVESVETNLEPGEETTIFVTLDPDENTSIKSFEFAVIFNGDDLTISSSNIGGFFSEYENNTYSSNGTIDEENGVIDDIYALIIGPGTVSNQGVLYTLHLSVSNTTENKTTLIQLTDTGITNETSYLPFTVQNLSLSINASSPDFFMSEPVPANQTTMVSKDLSSLQISLFSQCESPINYTITTYPNIGNTSGSLLENETITLPVSGLSYETTYEWTVNFTTCSTMISNTYTFTTEDKPDNNNDNHFPSNGGGPGFVPSESIDEEKKETIGPKTPLPPQGNSTVESGSKQTYTVTSWDINHDLIRFQIDWGNGDISNWSDFVSSNESVAFSHLFNQEKKYDIRVRVQDEKRLNSSWSKPLTVFVVSNNDKDVLKNPGRIVTQINNTTGEAQFSYEHITPLPENITLIWNFGDGTILQGRSPQHQYNKSGNFTIIVTVKDKKTNLTTTTYTVTIPPLQKVQTAVIHTEQNSENVSWVLILIGLFISVASVFVFYAIRFLK